MYEFSFFQINSHVVSFLFPFAGLKKHQVSLVEVLAA